MNYLMGVKKFSVVTRHTGESRSLRRLQGTKYPACGVSPSGWGTGGTPLSGSGVWGVPTFTLFLMCLSIFPSSPALLFTLLSVPFLPL